MSSIFPFGRVLTPKDAPPQTPAGLGVQSETQQTTLIYTVFTRAAEVQLVYSATSWVRVRMLLENAGPVQIGTKPNLLPVLGGAGTLLPVNEWVKFTLAKGTRLYIAANAINRVATIIEPVPGLELLMMRLDTITHAFGRLLGVRR